MEEAARDLDAGAFKLWCYFAKNQNCYDFDLSSKAVEETFGIKIKQYNNAIKELESKGYLVITKGNNYNFFEKPVNTKGNNAVITKEDNALLPKVIRNNTDTTNNNTTQNSLEFQSKEEFMKAWGKKAK